MTKKTKNFAFVLKVGTLFALVLAGALGSTQPGPAVATTETSLEATKAETRQLVTPAQNNITVPAVIK